VLTIYYKFIIFLESTTALKPEVFCDSQKKPGVSLPKPKMLKTEQSKADSQSGVVHGQTSRHRNFDLNKLPDEK